MPKLPSQKPICVSGGANGADFEWISHASNLCSVEIMSFEGHKCYTTSKANVKRIPSVELMEADSKLKEANFYLERCNYKMDLLRRNYFIIRDVDSCYAIVKNLFSKTKNNKTQVRVEGGTAWASQMFAIKFLKENFDKNQTSYEIPLYVFSQSDKKWYRAHCSVDQNVKITDLEWKVCIPPKPKSTFSAVGTRAIDSNGKVAIANLLENKSTWPNFVIPKKFAHVKNIK